MTVSRIAVPKRMERALYQEVGSRCPACGESDVSALTIHHIVAYAVTGKHDPEAMIVLCANCHARADRREITQDELFALKRTGCSNVSKASMVAAAAGQPAIHVSSQSAAQILNIAGSPNISIRASKRRPVLVTAPPGSVSEAQLREIDEEAARIANEAGSKVTVGFIKKRIMQQWSLTAMRNLPASEYSAVIAYMRKLRWVQRAREAPSAERGRLVRQIHAKANTVGWSHERLTAACVQWYGRTIGNLSVHLLRDTIARLDDIEARL